MKIYVVTSGSYSDYHIEAIFSNEEIAKAYPNGESVEEYELNPVFEHYDRITVTMAKNGDVIETDKSITTYDNQGFSYYQYGRERLDFDNVNKRLLVWNVHTDDEKTAIKVVNEKRIQILADDCWGLPENTEQLFKKVQK